MEITLKINGKDKTFVQEFVPLKFVRKALEVEKYASNPNYDAEELLDKRLNLIVEAFDKQFTKDELENGMNAIKHQETMYEIIGVGILGYPSLEEREEMGKFLEEMQGEKAPSTNESKK